MSIFSMILGMLPTLILAAEKIGADLAGHQKKQMVTDLLIATAQAVGQASPDNAKTATAAAALAVATMDSVVSVVKAAKPAVATKSVQAESPAINPAAAITGQ